MSMRGKITPRDSKRGVCTPVQQNARKCLFLRCNIVPQRFFRGNLVFIPCLLFLTRIVSLFLKNGICLAFSRRCLTSVCDPPVAPPFRPLSTVMLIICKPHCWLWHSTSFLLRGVSLRLIDFEHEASFQIKKYPSSTHSFLYEYDRAYNHINNQNSQHVYLKLVTAIQLLLLLQAITSGTSVSAPQMAGIASLILSMQGKGINPHEIDSRIASSSTPSSNHTGNGILDCKQVSPHGRLLSQVFKHLVLSFSPLPPSSLYILSLSLSSLRLIGLHTSTHSVLPLGINTTFSLPIITVIDRQMAHLRNHCRVSGQVRESKKSATHATRKKALRRWALWACSCRSIMAHRLSAASSAVSRRCLKSPDSSSSVETDCAGTLRHNGLAWTLGDCSIMTNKACDCLLIDLFAVPRQLDDAGARALRRDGRVCTLSAAFCLRERPSGRVVSATAAASSPSAPGASGAAGLSDWRTNSRHSRYAGAVIVGGEPLVSSKKKIYLAIQPTVSLRIRSDWLLIRQQHLSSIIRLTRSEILVLPISRHGHLYTFQDGPKAHSSCVARAHFLGLCRVLLKEMVISEDSQLRRLVSTAVDQADRLHTTTTKGRDTLGAVGSDSESAHQGTQADGLGHG
ncbi:hypothetical protein VP01_4441g1, partial [Puccinia sorghi]